MTAPKTLLTIEMLRGLAAISVMIAHIIIFGVNKFSFGSIHLFRISDALLSGVDLFFVMSGFVMVHATRMHKLSVKQFLLRRFMRIYPLYWLISLALLPVFLLHPEWVNASAAEQTSILHSLLLLPHAGAPLLMVAWTLEFEVYFYLLFAATMYLKQSRQVGALSIFMILCVLIGSIIHPAQPFLELATSPFLMEFVLGMVMAVFYEKIGLSGFFSIAFILAGLIYIAGIEMDILPRVLHFGIGSAVLFLGVLGLERKQKTPTAKTARLFGRLSYPLYLVHLPVIVAIGRFFQETGHPLPPAIYAVSTCSGAILAALCLYYLEKAMRNHTSRLTT